MNKLSVPVILFAVLSQMANAQTTITMEGDLLLQDDPETRRIYEGNFTASGKISALGDLASSFKKLSADRIDASTLVGGAYSSEKGTFSIGIGNTNGYGSFTLGHNNNVIDYILAVGKENKSQNYDESQYAPTSLPSGTGLFGYKNTALINTYNSLAVGCLNTISGFQVAALGSGNDVINDIYAGDYHGMGLLYSEKHWCMAAGVDNDITSQVGDTDSSYPSKPRALLAFGIGNSIPFMSVLPGMPSYTDYPETVVFMAGRSNRLTMPDYWTNANLMANVDEMYSFAIGHEGEVAPNSIVFGYGLKAETQYLTVLGRFNDFQAFRPAYSGDDEYGYEDEYGRDYTETDESPLFVLGNGKSDTERSNAMVVRRNGKTSFAETVEAKGIIVKEPSNLLSMGRFGRPETTQQASELESTQ